MAEDINTWIEKDVKPFLKQSTEKEDYQLFFRDECRPIYQDDQVFYSAADGIVLYNKILPNTKKKVEVKGINYTVDEILGDGVQLNGPVLVCGVFMTFADIHYNRVPYRGVLNFKQIDPIESYNITMDFMENDLFADLRKTHGDLIPKTNPYVKNNARMLHEFYIPELDYKYYLVQIADYQVDVFQPFDYRQGRKKRQNERFSFIRWGSQCDLILPLRRDIDIKPLIKPMLHVKAGVDKIIQFKHSGRRLDGK